MLPSVSENRDLASFLPLNLLPRFRIPEISFKPSKLLVLPPGKDNRESGKKGECPHPPGRPILEVVSFWPLNLTQEPRRRAEGRVSDLRKAAQFGGGAGSPRPSEAKSVLEGFPGTSEPELGFWAGLQPSTLFCWKGRLNLGAPLGTGILSSN